MQSSLHKRGNSGHRQRSLSSIEEASHDGSVDLDNNTSSHSKNKKYLKRRSTASSTKTKTAQYDFQINKSWKIINAKLSVSRRNCEAIIIRKTKKKKTKKTKNKKKSRDNHQQQYEHVIVALGGYPETDVVEAHTISHDKDDESDDDDDDEGDGDSTRNTKEDSEETIKWKELCRMPVALRNFGCLFNKHDDTIYVFGGHDCYGVQDSFYKYRFDVTRDLNDHNKDKNKEDESLESWEDMSSIARLNISRCSMSTAIIKSKIYAIGGYDGYNRLDSIEVYDTFDGTTDGSASSYKKWKILPAKLNTKRSGHCSIVIKRLIYVIGGQDDKGNILDTIEIYNTKYSRRISSSNNNDNKNRWIQLYAKMNTKRYGATAVAIGCNYILIMGGNDGHKDLNTVEIFDVAKNEFITNTFICGISNSISSATASTSFPSMINTRSGAAAVLLNTGDDNGNDSDDDDNDSDDDFDQFLRDHNADHGQNQSTRSCSSSNNVVVAIIGGRGSTYSSTNGDGSNIYDSKVTAEVIDISLC